MKKALKMAVTLFSVTAMVLMPASCSQKNDAVSGGATADADSSGNTSQVTSEEIIKDDLGEFDFKGAEFRVFTRGVDFLNASIDFEESNGEVYNDAVCDRNRRIEDRFNFRIVQSQGTDMNVVKKTLLSGENAYDLIITRCPDAFVYAQDGLIHGFDKLPHINLEKPYWDKYMNDSLTISNKRYFAVGAFNVPAYDFIHVLLFNKQLVQDYNLTQPYQSVLDGTWTYAKFEEMVKGVTKDLDGNGVMDASDLYGFLSTGKQVLPCFWISAGIKSVEKDKDDIPYSIIGTDKFINIFQKIFTFTHDINAWYKSTSGVNLDPEFIKMFQANQALFMDSTFFYIPQLREMTADFGIIPFPKLDESQTEYYSRMEGCDLMCVPSSADTEALERTSIILEALTADSYTTVIPAYYEIALKTKFTRDPESMQMLDIIFKNRVFDFGDTIWCTEIRDGVIADMYIKNNRDIVSKNESLDRTIDKLVTKVVTAFQKLD